MPKIIYEPKIFNPQHQGIIDKANQLIATYNAQGYQLTLRQLYYQFVTRDWFPEDRSWKSVGGKWVRAKDGSRNAEPNYKWLGDILNEARLAGQVDWHAMEDRTRNLAGNSHWTSPASIIESCYRSFAIDKWSDQPYYVEVWVEKDAIEGVVARACQALDINYFSCRGYSSATSLWDAGQRLKRHASNDRKPVILHLGDHDPSGMDMSRDIEERVSLFMDGTRMDLNFKRIALNMDQVEQYNPPPNPTKLTDKRSEKYIELYGDECWELDALEPSVIDELIRDEVAEYRDEKLYKAQEVIEKGYIAELEKCSQNWPRVSKFLNKIKGKK